MSTSDRTIELLKTSNQQQMLEKAFNQALGLVWYDLEPGAKQLYPVITPLRNRIPRVKGNGGTATNWKAITAINTTNIAIGVSEGNRGGVQVTAASSYAASYKGIGLEDFVTWEGDYAAENFDDVKALAVEGLLRSLMIGEEAMLLGGNASMQLGVTPTPVSVLVAGGSMTAQADVVYCVALTIDGYLRSTVAGGVVGSIARTNADASSDTFGGGCAQVSVASNTITTAGGNLSVSSSVAAVKGAFAYAWYVGTSAATAALGQITTINSVLFTANPTGTQFANAAAISADNSTNALGFDGIITQAINTGANGYYKAQATGTNGTGTPLTSDSAGGIVEIDAAFKQFWDSFRLSPTLMVVNSQELLNISKKVISGGAAPLFRFVMDSKQGGGVNNLTLTAGSVVGSYLNKFTMGGGSIVPVMLHPNLPAGTILFFSDEIPYPLSNVRNVLQVKTRREYYQILWALRSRKYEYGVYADELLQCYFPPAFGIITNIGNG